MWLYYCCEMAEPTRFSVAQHLAELGLRKALIAVESTQGYTVSGLKKTDSTLEFTRLGIFSAGKIPVVGRVGVPDPQLGVSWKDTLTFSGKWFDELGETDPGYHLRKTISSLSHERLMEQIKRDDQYALVGSYYAAFRTIMEVKHRIPLVLIDDAHLSLGSFPVVLPMIDDVGLKEKFQVVLTTMLKADSGAQSEPADAGGIEVDEVSAEDLSAHFTQGNA